MDPTAAFDPARREKAPVVKHGQKGFEMPSRWQIPRTVPRLSVACRGTGACAPFRDSPRHRDCRQSDEESSRARVVSARTRGVHAERRREAAISRSSFARDARSARRASCAIRNASSIVSASVMRSGATGLVTTNPPSSAFVRVSTSLPSETVYDLATAHCSRP